MPLNEKSANSNADLTRFSDNLENIVDVIGTPLPTGRIGGKIGDVLNEHKLLLSEMVEKIDKPILKSLATDMLNVMSGWFDTPTIMCCLIQGLTQIHLSSIDYKNLQEYEKSFAKFMDHLIAFIDLISVIIKNDIKGLSLGSIDFIKDIMDAVMGAVLIVIQETVFTLRDSAIDEILKWMENWDDDMQVFSKCFQLSDFLGLIKKYVHDYGILADVFSKMQAFIAGKFKTWEKFIKTDYIKNIKDLEFLYWLRELFVKLKQAGLNFDLCISYAYELPDNKENIKPNDITFTPISKLLAKNDNTINGDPTRLQGISITNDGTILLDKNKLDNGSIPYLSNDSIRNFLNKYYGMPIEVAETALRGASSADSIQGSNINSNRFQNIIADCPDKISPEEILQWALKIKTGTK